MGMKVGIIGLGLIGGSMAIDLKRKGFADQILGVEAEPVNASAAEKIGLLLQMFMGQYVENNETKKLQRKSSLQIKRATKEPYIHAKTAIKGEHDVLSLLIVGQ